MAKLKIKSVMKEKDVSQYALAKSMNMQSSNLKRILDGQTDPKFSTLSKIATELGVRVRDLIDE